jgi:hypothetical protein
MRVKTYLSRRVILALKGEKPGKMPVVLPVKVSARYLEVG